MSVLKLLLLSTAVSARCVFDDVSISSPISSGLEQVLRSEQSNLMGCLATGDGDGDGDGGDGDGDGDGDSDSDGDGDGDGDGDNIRFFKVGDDETKDECKKYKSFVLPNPSFTNGIDFDQVHRYTTREAKLIGRCWITSWWSSEFSRY